jgi:hypothetical protein
MIKLEKGKIYKAIVNFNAKYGRITRDYMIFSPRKDYQWGEVFSITVDCFFLICRDGSFEDNCFCGIWHGDKISKPSVSDMLELSNHLRRIPKLKFNRKTFTIEEQ